MNPQIFLSLFMATILVDAIVGAVKKSPPYLAAPFVHLWKETVYLRGFLCDKRFAAWKPETGRYVALKAIKAQSAKQTESQPVLDLLEAFLKRGEPVVLLGEPGAGKTTALEALTYRLARRAYRVNVLLWFGLLFVAALLSFVNPLLNLLWLASLVLWESLARRATVPFFVEARSDYAGGEVSEWLEKILKKNLGDKPLFGSHNRAMVLVDGMNETQANLYGMFVEGWRKLLEKNTTRAVFTSRAGEEDPAPRLQVDNTLTVCDLDDAGVQEFLQAVGRERAARENKPYAAPQAEQDFDALKKNNLLGEKGIGRNPYWLRMMVESGIYTCNRGLLFRNFVKQLLHREIEEKPEERRRKSNWRTVPLEIEMDALGSLALAMHQARSIGFSGEEGWNTAYAAIRKNISNSRYTPDDVLDEAEAATLVRNRFSERIEFVHQLIQEFYVAWKLDRDLRDKKGDYATVLGHLSFGGKQWDRKNNDTSPLLLERGTVMPTYAIHEEPGSWDEVIVMLAGIIDQPVELIKWLTARVVEDQQGPAAFLIQRCLEASDATRDPEALDALMDAFTVVLQDPNESVRVDAAMALWYFHHPRAIELILAFLPKLHRQDQLAMSSALQYLYNQPYAIKGFTAALHNPDVEVRRIAASVLGNIRDPHAAEELIITLLHEKDMEVRRRAAVTLGKIGDLRALSVLDRLVGEDQDRSVIDAAREAADQIRQRMKSE